MKIVAQNRTVPQNDKPPGECNLDERLEAEPAVAGEGARVCPNPFSHTLRDHAREVCS